MPACPRCRSQIDLDAKFCGTCGAPTGVVQTTAAPTPASPSGPVSQVEDLLGRVLNDRYRIDRKLGEGGFGAVFEGLHLQMGRPVAIKVLHPALTRDPKMAERFRREAQAACSLRDPHTVTTHDFDQSPEGVLYIVMELIRGRSLLAEIQQRGALTAARAVALVDQVCSALAEAHAQDIVHRDIKPENILIEDRPSHPDFVKVVDFGIAKIMHDPKGDTIAKLTAAGQIFGTLEYMAPEQLAGDAIDHRADIYALGAMLYQMLTGVPPFTGTPSQLIAAHLNADPPPPSRRRGEIPAALDAVVLRCMAKDPGARFPDVVSLRQALGQPLPGPPPAILHSTRQPAAPIPPTVGPSPATGPGQQPPRVSRPAPVRPRRIGLPLGVWIAIVLAILLVVGVGAFAIYRAMESGARQGATEQGSSGGGTVAFAAPGEQASPGGRWTGEAALLRLAPPRSGLLLLLRPARLMQLPGVAQIWRRHLEQGAREMTRVLAAGPARMELALLVFPALPEDGAEPDGFVVVRGVDAAAALGRLRAMHKPEVERYAGESVERFPAPSGQGGNEFAVAQLDDRTLLAGSPVVVKQGLTAAADKQEGSPVDPAHLAYLRAGLPEKAQLQLRQWFQLPPSSRVEQVVVAISHPAPTLTLSAELTTDSTRTAETLAVWVRQILQSQGSTAEAALLRRASVTPQGSGVTVTLSGPAEEMIRSVRMLAERQRPGVR